MRLLSLIATLLFSSSAFAVGPSPSLGQWWASVGSGGGGAEPLIEPENIIYDGYFVVPKSGADVDTFVYTKGGMWATSAGGAPGTGALYLSNIASRVGAINIPAAPFTGQTATVNTPLGGYLYSDIVSNSADLPQPAPPATPDFSGMGSVSGTTITITSIAYGSVVNTWPIMGPGIPYGTRLTFGGTGTGGLGTYTLSQAATTASGNYGQDPNGLVISGIVPRSDGNLLVTYYWYYPGGPCCSKNAIILSSDLTTVIAYDQQLGSGYDPSQFAGMAGTVGSEWQTALGGSYLTGQGTLVANDSRGVAGPSSYVFDPNFSATTSPVSLAALAHYPYTPGSENIVTNWSSRPTTGTWTTVSNMDRGAAVAVPHGFSSLMVIGAHGTGPYCYGDPTSDPTLQRVPNGAGITQCYDLGVQLSGPSDKGVHSWPYEPWVWLWRVSDVEQVLSGVLQPWQVQPYAAFQLPWPTSAGFASGDAFAGSGAAYYDQSTGYLYMICAGGSPMKICVWKVQSSSTTPFAITTAQNLPGCTHGVTCTTTLTSSGGASPVTWHLLYTNPSYLSALSLSTDGTLTLSSADTQTGTFDVIVEATDANGQDNTIGLSLTIN